MLRAKPYKLPEVELGAAVDPGAGCQEDSGASQRVPETMRKGGPQSHCNRHRGEQEKKPGLYVLRGKKGCVKGTPASKMRDFVHPAVTASLTRTATLHLASMKAGEYSKLQVWLEDSQTVCLRWVPITPRASSHNSSEIHQLPKINRPC